MVWREIEKVPVPKDGQEYLVCNVRQGGIKQLVSWNIVHRYWQIKGLPDVPFQWTHWTPILNLPTRKEA